MTAIEEEELLNDKITHCLGELIFIVKHTYSFEDGPAKSVRQIDRNKKAEERAFKTLKSLIESRESALSQQHEREIVEAKIQEHANLWEAVPIDTEHVGTVRDISDLMVVKLKARAELQQQSNGGKGDGQRR
jgi:hypothetical protein